MENTRTGAFYLPKTKVIHTLLLVLAVFTASRNTMMGDCFPAGVALTAYLVGRNSKNIYMIVPIAAGIIPYISKGYEPWGELAAILLCIMVFTAARRLELEVWHRAVIAATCTIISICAYRPFSQSVYRLDVERLLLEAAVVFALVYVFEAAGRCAKSTGSEVRQVSGSAAKIENFKVYSPEITIAAVTTIACLIVNGAGLGFMLWPVIVFISIGMFAYTGFGNAVLAAAAGTVFAAFVGQAQWGFAAALMISFAAGALVLKYGRTISVIAFAAVCWLLESVESGVVLGADGYYLFFAVGAFLAFDWRFSKSLRRIFVHFAGGNTYAAGEPSDVADEIFGTKSAELRELAELYGTYLDSRSMIADQLNVTAQIIDDIRLQTSMHSRTVARSMHEKFDAQIAVSQCAAAGTINGDCCGWRDIGDGRVAMVVSDGMGKGKKAAAESLLVTKTILTLLEAGVSVDMTLKMINTVMLMKDDEDSYATVDLVIIDKKSGTAKFYKIGAAPTLIRRKNNVEEVRLAAAPLGIVNGIRIRYVETELKKDDWIIMMSDGISDGGEVRGGIKNGAFLQNIKAAAADVRSEDPRTMSDLILNRAADSYIGRERDDMTVVVARII